MYKDGVFLIKRSAHRILVEAYKHCNSKLECYDFNYQEAIGEDCSKENAAKSKMYLESIEAITHTGDRTYQSFKLTAKGIEIAEEIIFNSLPSPKKQEPINYQPNSTYIVGSDCIKAGGSKRKFEAIFTDGDSVPQNISLVWKMECTPSHREHINYCISEDGNSCEISVDDVQDLIGTQIKLMVSDMDGIRDHEKLIDIVGLFC